MQSPGPQKLEKNKRSNKCIFAPPFSLYFGSLLFLSPNFPLPTPFRTGGHNDRSSCFCMHSTIRVPALCGVGSGLLSCPVQGPEAPGCCTNPLDALRWCHAQFLTPAGVFCFCFAPGCRVKPQLFYILVHQLQNILYGIFNCLYMRNFRIVSVL